MSKKMISCKACGQEIAKSAKVCPHCGAKNKQPLFKKWRFWAVIVILFVVIGTSCNNTTNKKADNHSTNLKENTPTNTTTISTETPNSSEDVKGNGDSTVIENTNQLLDYSDFGFDNMYGFTEWIRIGESIYDYSFYFTESRPVINIYNDYYILNFENSYIEARYFEMPETFFTGDRSAGELEDVYQYNIINSSLIALNTSRAPNIEMTASSWNGMPLIELSISGDGYGVDFLEGIFIPTHFLDAECSHVLDDSSAVYYFTDEYFNQNPLVDKCYNFATELLEAVYKDFDSSIIFDALPPTISQSARDQAEANDFDWHDEFSNYKATYGNSIMWTNVRADMLHDTLLDDGLVDYLNDLEEEYSIKLNSDSYARIEFILFSNDPYLYGPVTLYIAEIEGELYYLNPAGLLYPLLSNG